MVVIKQIRAMLTLVGVCFRDSARVISPGSFDQSCKGSLQPSPVSLGARSEEKARSLCSWLQVHLVFLPQVPFGCLCFLPLLSLLTVCAGKVKGARCPHPRPLFAASRRGSHRVFRKHRAATACVPCAPFTPPEFYALRFSF